MAEKLADETNHYYGKDCPNGMVQVEFVGVGPSLKYSDYGWKPSESAFLDVYVDGQRFNIKVGTFESVHGGTRRGLHIIGPMDIAVHKHSLNALDVFLPEASDPAENRG